MFVNHRNMIKVTIDYIILPSKQLQYVAGPPTISFTWRHWADYEGFFHAHAPTNEQVMMIGSAVATVNDDMKITRFEIYYDPNPLLSKLYHGKCIFAQK